MAFIELRQTCGACPEQYDAYDLSTGDRVGYLRLRHGHFTVTCPWVQGELVYEGSPIGDGIFMEEERERYLGAAKDAIAEWLFYRDQGRSNAPLVNDGDGE